MRPAAVIGISALFASGAYAQGGAYAQCGGINWTGTTACISGYTCTVINDYYYQCLPGGPSTTPAPTGPTTGNPTPTSSAPGNSGTLVPGMSFVRAVTTPNFHKYLRSETAGQPSDAILGEPNTAAQFKITSGQLIQAVGSSSLYAVVEPRANSTVMKLKVSWSATQATSGTFSWSGDTLMWNNPSVSRPQDNAWLVCPDSAGNRDLYINLGPYSYNTPAGCNDHTIHAYTGQTADA